MELVELKLKNFLSFKELTHRFVNSPVLIQGRNLTDDSKETNGSGKSTIEAAIAYAIMATPMRKGVLDRDLIRWGEQEAEIELRIYCSVRKQTLTIQRKLSIKGSAKLELYLSPLGEDFLIPVSFATVNDGNRYILNWIGITTEDLKSFYILNKENYRSFMSSSNTDKLALINRFIKADGLDNADDIIKKRKEPLVAAQRKAEQSLYSIQGEIQALERELEAERERNTEQEKQSRIEAVNQQIDETLRQYDDRMVLKSQHEEQYKAARILYEQVKKQVEQAQQAWDGRTVTDFSERKNSLKGMRDKMNDIYVTQRKFVEGLESDVQKARQAVFQFDTLLSGIISCPNCGFKFNPGDGVPAQELERNKGKAEQEFNRVAQHMERAQGELERNLASVKEVDDLIEGVRKEEDVARDKEMTLQAALLNVKRSLIDTDTKMSKLKSIVDSDDKVLETLTERAEELSQRLERIENEAVVTREEDIESSIKLARKRLDKAQAQLNKATNRVVEMEQWGQRFKDFKMSLACEQLKLIQDAANLSLQRQKSELRLSVDGFKRNAKGQIKSEITVLVINGEGEYKSFWSYSGGERARVEMALIQAFQEMINSTNPYGGLNFLMVDEVLEGTDPLGLALLFESMKDICTPVYVISHIMNIRADIPTLTVVKEEGCSYIEE